MRCAHILAVCLLLAAHVRCYAPTTDAGGDRFNGPNNGSKTGTTTDGSGVTTSGNLQQVAFSGNVSGLMGNQTLVLANGSNQVTVTQNGEFAFPNTIGIGQSYSAYIVTQPQAQQCYIDQSQGVAAAGGVNLLVTCLRALRFSVNQNARTVLGQTNYTSYARNFNQTVAAANSVSNPWGEIYASDSGALYLTDSLNSRLLGYRSLPTSDGQNADFLVGQPNFMGTGFGCSATSFEYVSGVTSDHRGGLLLTDMVNNRVLMYATEFSSAGAVPAGAVGQPTLTANAPGCTATTLNRPLSATSDGKMLAVGDASNNRVLVWASLPAANSFARPATFALGQPDLVTCNIPSAPSAGTIHTPQGVWTNGDILAVVAVDENRILIWNHLAALIANPANGANADVVIGQPDMTSAAASAGPAGLAGPQYIISDGTQLIVADTENSRVLIYSTLTPGNGQAATAVLGQADFNAHAPQGGASGLASPDGLGVAGKSLIVADGTNDRFLIFDSL